MKRIDIQVLIEIRQLAEEHGLKEIEEAIDMFLRLLEEGEEFELTKNGKVIAHVVPVHESKSTVEQDIQVIARIIPVLYLCTFYLPTTCCTKG